MKNYKISKRKRDKFLKVLKLNNSKKVNILTIREKMKIKYEEAVLIGTTLEDMGYVTRSVLEHDKNSKYSQYFYELTKTGNVYFETESDEKTRFFRRNILVAIVLAILSEILLRVLLSLLRL